MSTIFSQMGDIVGTAINNEITRATNAEAGLQTQINTLTTNKVDNSRVLTDVPAGAIFTDTVYTHPATHSIAEVSGLQSALDLKFNISGGNIGGSIIPTEDITFDLGSPTKMWRDIYVGPGSLYVNGQKVIQDNAGTIVISADDNQNVQLKTGGGGDIEFYPSGTGAIEMKGNLSIQAGMNLTSSDGNPINCPVGFGTLAVQNLTVTGTTTTVDTAQLNVNDNIITLNSNVTGIPVTDAGIEVERGDSNNAKIIYNESIDKWQFSNDGATYTDLGEQLTKTDIDAMGIDADLLDGKQGLWYQRNLKDDNNIELFANGTGDRVCYIDFHSSDTPPEDYNARIFRGAGDNENLTIYNTGTGVITFQVDGNNTLQLSSTTTTVNGNVGIDAIPWTNLDVKTGTDRRVAFTDNAAASTITGITDGGASAPLRVTGYPLIFSGNGGVGAEQVRLDSSGNLGIGTGSPVSAKLEINGSSDQIQLLVQGHSTQTSDIFAVENSAGTDLLTVDNSGNLDVAGKAIIQTSGSTIKAGPGSILFSQQAGSSGVAAIGGNINLHFNPPTGGYTVTNYYNGSKLAIGNGASGFSGTEFLADGSANFGAGVFIDGSVDDIQLKVQGHSTQTSDIFVVEDSAGTDLLTVDNSGNLDVAGTGTFGGSATSGNALYLQSGDISTFPAESTQIRFGYNNTDTYTHSIRTRHNSDIPQHNAIDFYLWKHGTDAASDLGTHRALTLDLVSSTLSGGLLIDGHSDDFQLKVQGNAVQTSDIFVVETSAGTDLLTVDNSGDTYIAGKVGVGAVPINNGFGIFSTGGGQLRIYRDDLTITSNEELGSIQFQATQGSGLVGAAIRGESTQSWVNGSAAGGRLILRTTPDNSVTSTDRVVITQDGRVNIGPSKLPGGKLQVQGEANEIQLRVIGNSTQSNDIMVVEQSDGTDILNVDNSGNLTVAGIVDVGNYINHTATSSRDKIRVWDNGSYNIGMQNGFNYGYLGSNTLHSGTTDYAMTFQMNTTTSRGFWWGNTGQSNSQGAMSLTNDGKLYVDNLVNMSQCIVRNNLALTNDYAALLFDGTPSDATGFTRNTSGPKKRIACNDGGGNFNIWSGGYYNGGQKYVAAGDGASKITLNSDGINGYIALSVASTGTNADDPITWSNTLDITTSTVTVSNDLVVSGNLTVSGTTTTVNTEELNIADNIITLNSDYTGSTPTENAGIDVERGTLTNVGIQWNETEDKWYVHDGTNWRTLLHAANAISVINSLSGLDADTLDSLDSTSFLRSDVADIKTAGDLTFNDAVIMRFGTDADSELFFNGSHTVLDINTGDFYIRDGAASNATRYLFDVSAGDFHADGDITAYSTSVGSDIKLKENIKNIENPIEKINQLNGVEFDWKRNGEKSAGVIAQDVEKVLPQAVKEKMELNGDDTYKTVNYDALHAILIEAVKELSARVVELEKKLGE